MSITLSALQKQRRDTAANWTAENPTLLAGEIGLESDTGYWKVGDGVTVWTSLAYVSGLGAEIPVDRLADGAARQLLQTDAAGTGVEWTDDIDVPGTLDVTGAATFDDDVTIQGDLTVNGTTTTIDTTTLVVEDKNIEIGKVATPTDVTADGGGITLKGSTDKTINWVDATDAWTLSEHVDIASAKEYRIAGTKVLDATSLGSSVLITSANITDGTIVDGDVNASAAIAGTKISPDFGSQNVTTTGTATAAAFIPSGSSVPTNGVYLPSANNVAISSNGVGRVFIDSDGTVRVNTSITATSAGGFGVEATSSGNVTAPLTMLNRGTGNDSGVGLTFRGLSAASAETDYGYFRMVATDTTSRHGRIELWTTNSGTPTEKLRITHDGKLGLGTSSPSKNFEIAATSSEAAIALTSSGRTLLLSSHEQPGVSEATKLGTSSNHELRIITNNTEAIRIDTSQRVGIGTTSPTDAVHAARTGDSVYFKADSDSVSTVYGSASALSTGLLGTFTNHSLSFYTNSSERARIDSSGRLLVGTSSDDVQFGSNLQVVRNTSTSVLASRYSADTGGPVLFLAKSRGASIGTKTVVQSGDETGKIDFRGTDGTNHLPTATITSFVDGTPGSNDMPGRLVFSTTSDGASSPTERLRLDRNGNLHLGVYTNPTGGTGIMTAVAYAMKQGVNGAPTGNGFNWYWNGSSLSAWVDTSNVGTVTLTSDYRIKKDVVLQSANATERIKKLRPVEYQYKDYGEVFKADGVQREGFIAHELAEVIPSAVEGEKDAENQIQSLRVDALVSVLTKALQESITRIETLEAKVAALEAQ